MYSDSVDFILEDYISPHGLLTDAWCPVVAGSVVTQPPGGLALLIVPVICLKYTAWKMGGNYHRGILYSSPQAFVQ